MADLPAVIAPAGAASTVEHHSRDWIRSAWGAWASAVVVSVAVWGAVSLSAQQFVYFWPIWVAGPGGAALLARTLFGTQHGRRGRQDGERDHR